MVAPLNKTSRSSWNTLLLTAYLLPIGGQYKTYTENVRVGPEEMRTLNKSHEVLDTNLGSTLTV